MGLRAVIFDLGGVVMPSPIEAFREYERQADLPHRFISEVIIESGDTGAWSKLERGELTLTQFGEVFEAECREAGQQISVERMLECLYTGGEARPAMITAINRIKEEGLGTAALTNNWGVDDEMRASERATTLLELFDVVVESHKEGLRKPDPRIYELTCDRLGVTPSEAAFLDDLGVNLKPARSLGMVTIKVEDADAALAELEKELGFSLAAK